MHYPLPVSLCLSWLSALRQSLRHSSPWTYFLEVQCGVTLTPSTARAAEALMLLLTWSQHLVFIPLPADKKWTEC